MGANKGNENNKNRKSGNEVRDKDVSGSKSVATSNRFDLLCEEGGSEAIDPWNDVKIKVANACNTSVPIEESVLKGWNADMDNLKPLCKLEDLSYTWAEIVSGLSIKVTSNSIWSIIQRLVFGAAVYFIWQERNFRIFRNEFRTEEHVFKIIVDTVRHKIMGLRIKHSCEVGKAMAIWKLSVNGSNGSGRMGFDDGIDGVT
ncbi:reverse transcriptase domain, Reverse transcriptase zinc-binding domain protein [Artemisia annua]|uniref:Reverse transcriptase domain, Reverse transcriptase zinc-binding domain protein n=1 Tax=Artemisia annua TaxID=35608 RepID=A0A2U1KKL9_ARTAN|nr:reverse transcriptase domain, Reverse transcriptase zinc-binding domain protein [Artemisia annua]